MAILNADGTPMKKQELLEEVAGPSITGVRPVISGHPAQGLDPRRLASLLRSAENGDPLSYFELAEEMEEKDLHYIGVLGTRKRAVSGLELVVEAADTSKEAGVQADFVKDVLNRDTIQEELFDVLDAVGKGISFTEIMWDLSEKEWRPAKLEWRDPRWFTFAQEDGRTPLVRNGSTGDPLPDYKFITHEVKAKSGLPIRSGIARAVSWYYMFKNFAVKDWIVFAEVYGQPIRIGKYHRTASEKDKDVLRRAVAMIGTDAAAIIPDSMMLEFVKDTTQKGSSDLYKTLADWIDQQVSKAILGQTTTTDAISGGHAVSKEHQEVRIDIQQSDAGQLATSLNRFLIKPMIDLNYGPQKVYPKVKLPIPESLDPQVFSLSLKNSAEAGLRIPAKWARDKMGIPEPEGDEEVIGITPPPPDKTPPETASARASDHQDEGDLIDEMINTIINEQGFEMTEPVLRPIFEMVAKASSFEEVEEGLKDLLGTIDTRKVTEVLSNALFTASVAGQLDISTKK